jgi:hypothetical protein
MSLNQKQAVMLLLKDNDVTLNISTAIHSYDLAQQNPDIKNHEEFSQRFPEETIVEDALEKLDYDIRFRAIVLTVLGYIYERDTQRIGLN